MPNPLNLRHLRILDTERGAPLVHLSQIRAVSFSPDDRFIAAGVGKKVQVWLTPGRRHQIAPLSLLRDYGGLQDDVTCLAWAPDSRHLVAGAYT